MILRHNAAPDGGLRGGVVVEGLEAGEAEDADGAFLAAGHHVLPVAA